MSDIIEQIQPLWTSDWKLQPGNLVSLALDPRASVEPLLDRDAILEARLMRPHRVAALVDVVDGDWAQVMLVGIHDGTKKRQYEPSIPLAVSPLNVHPTLVVYPLRRHTVRVVKLHAPSGFAVPVLEPALFDARVTMLGVALHGRKCRTTASRRWDLEEAAKQMYARPQDIRLHGDEEEDMLGVAPCVEVWPEFELDEVWEPDALVSDLKDLDDLEVRKYERDAQKKERDSAREHGAAMLRTLKLIRHWQAPAPGESVKTFLRRTFQKTMLYPIEDSDTEDDDAKLPVQRRPSAFRPARAQGGGLLEGAAYCLRWVWNAVKDAS